MAEEQETTSAYGGLYSMPGQIIGAGIQTAMAKAEAKRNRRFQRQMSNTAYRRAVRDMKAAGINPILAYQQGGASTPPGAVAPIADFGSAFGGGVSTAIQVLKAKAEIAAIKQGTATAKAQEHLTDNKADVLDPISTASELFHDSIVEPITSGIRNFLGRDGKTPSGKGWRESVRDFSKDVRAQQARERRKKQEERRRRHQKWKSAAPRKRDQSRKYEDY